jgi:hypothetical protein
MTGSGGPGARTHTCPGECGITNVPFSRFACRNCWWKLPAEIRVRINITYRARGSADGRRAHAQALADGHRWYRNRLPHVIDTPGERDD